MNFNSKHLPLIIAIALPLVFILVISIIIFTPSLFIKPQHNFLYTTDNSYYSYDQGFKNTYAVKNSHIVTDPLPIPANSTYQPQKDSPAIYLYDVQSDSSHEVTFTAAQNYLLDPGPSSPDGYTVSYQYGHDGIFEIFGSNGNNSNYVISKGNGKKKLSGITNDRYYGQGGFKLIGWVK